MITDVEEALGHGPDDVRLVQEAAAVAVSWVLKGRLTLLQSDLLAMGDHGNGHEMIGAAMWVTRWETALRDALDGATDSEESRQRVAAAKDKALRDMRTRLHHHVTWDFFRCSSDWPGAHEVLRRIIAADGPEAR